MSTISVIHPSRGRPMMAYECINEWLSNVTGKNTIQYILSCDIDDKGLGGYEGITNYYEQQYLDIYLLVSQNNNVVDAMNNGAKLAIGEVLVCVSDDFSCFKGWDEWILENINPEKEQALGVSDGLQPTSIPIMTLPIITRKLYKRLGFVYYPEYIGMMADNDLAERCIAMGVYKENKKVTFKHSHWVTGKYTQDETNRRHDNIPGWENGRRILQEQRLKNFGVKKIISC